MSDDPNAKTLVTRVLGVVGGLVLGAVVGAIAMAVATLVGESQAYSGYIPTPTIGGFVGAGIGAILGLLFPEKCGYAFVWFIAN